MKAFDSTLPPFSVVQKLKMSNSEEPKVTSAPHIVKEEVTLRLFFRVLKGIFPTKLDDRTFNLHNIE